MFERKYELDSLCAFLKLSNEYFAATGDTGAFDSEWVSAVRTVLDTMAVMQQPATALSAYTFQRCV